uniref:2S storage protein-like albumin n=2 Tax=Dicranopteris TaxID=37228 RepID=Q7FZ84_DICLI|nr:2S storage protein-like albumin precursor [Dicranopteris linearis]AAF17602.1 2S storage protein-like albumin precursor [Dicranopteris curranii]
MAKPACCALLALLFMASVAPLALAQRPDWRRRLQACDSFMEGRHREPRYRDRPSESCCRSVRNIREDERCRALMQAYGGGGYSDQDDDVVAENDRQEEQASRLLRECNLEPRDCRRRNDIFDDLW